MHFGACLCHESWFLHIGNLGKMFYSFTHSTPPLLNKSFHHAEASFSMCFSLSKPVGNGVQALDEQQAPIQLPLPIAVNKDWTTEREGGYPCPDTG